MSRRREESEVLHMVLIIKKLSKIYSGATNYLQPKPVVKSVKAGDCKIVGVVESGSTMESGSLLWPKIHSSAASKAFVFVLS